MRPDLLWHGGTVALVEDHKAGGEVLTPAEAADLLKISERVLRRQTAAGLIPSFKIGRQVRYRRALLDRLGMDEGNKPPE